MLKAMLWIMLCALLLSLGYSCFTSIPSSEERRAERKKVALAYQMKAEPRIQELFDGEIVSPSKTLGETGLISTVVKSSNGFIMSAWSLSTHKFSVGQKVKIVRVECGGNETTMCGSNNEAYWITSK